VSGRYAIGVDFGTESARALLVDVADGRELATATMPYPHGVIDATLPDTDAALPPSWALQHPGDYLECLGATVRDAVRDAGVDPHAVIGLGIDFTACTILPAKADGTPLCLLPEWRDRPHAWVKLWKHHAAQPQADRLNALARRQGRAFLDRYGGKISSEWFFPKVMQILDEDPAVYAAADRILEAQDWVIWQLVGHEARSLTVAGYKAIHSTGDGYPAPDFLAALHPGLADVVRTRMATALLPPGARAGTLSRHGAELTGLGRSTSVAVANMDAHVSVPACRVTEPGRMVMVMGTSICHLLLGEELRLVEGMCGVVRDGVIPGWWGYEAGQASVGDMFGWFVRRCVPGDYEDRARAEGLDLHGHLEREAARLAVGEAGMIALDWWNGNRSTLVDVELTGALVGATIATRPEEIYRTLLESVAFGTRVIVDAFAAAGLAVDSLVGCGGLPRKSPLLMQIMADVTERPVYVAASEQAPALGAAMYGAVAAGGHGSIEEASAAMAHLDERVFRPAPGRAGIYGRLYADYRRLYDHFGRDAGGLMHRLTALRRDVMQAAR
jgi:L-ribulokinase